MAIAQPIIRMVKRSKGHSAVGGAAYRSGEKLHDERLGITHNYSNKKDVISSEILAPVGAPDWVYDREKLWNNAEAKERQFNGQPAREIIFVLPRELTDQGRGKLVHDFALSQFVGRGMIADINHHAPDSGDGGKNYHAHVMLTMRELDGGDFAKTKQRQWNRDFTDGGQNIDPEKGGFYNITGKGDGWISNHKGGVMGFRQDWQNAVNEALEESGSAERVDLRSYKEQGVNLEPQQKIGINAPDRRGNKKALVTAANDNIEDRNEVRRYFEPSTYKSRIRHAAAKVSQELVDEDLEAFYNLRENERAPEYER